MTHLAFQDYQTLAMATQAGTVPPTLDRAEWMTVNAALGMAGEAGEVADHIKKWLFHGHPVDYNKLDNEVGDILWYLAQYAESRGTTLDDLAQMNLEKLRKRYASGHFSTEASLNRSPDDI